MPTPWLSVATHFKGLTEVHGSVNDPQIVEMFRISGHPEVKEDETPWCAAFVGACLRLSGYASSGGLNARSYARFGDDLQGQPQRGCVVVFWRESPDSGKGHVAFLDHEAGDQVAVLGGNQSDAVGIQLFPKNRVIAYRWPSKTGPLPTDTTLPTILTIDPTNAPPYVLSGAPAAAAVPAIAGEGLADGAEGRDVSRLQSALAAQGFQPGPLDGDFGPLTREAVTRFQTARTLPVTGVADAGTLRVLGLASISGDAKTFTPAEDTPTMQPQDILKIVVDALIAGRQGAAGTTTIPAAPSNDLQPVLQAVLAALAGQAVPVVATGPTATAPTPATPTPPVLSSIDKIFGGEAMAGKKTLLAVVAYVILAILQAVGVAGTATGPTATPTGEILTTLIGAFGALGGLSKVDRIGQLLALIAGRSSPTQS